MTDLEALRDLIASRFRAHKAAEFTYQTGTTTPGATGVVEVVLIPEFLFRDADDANGLLIVVKGKGVHTWTGRGPLNAFQLVASGIRPMGLAQHLASLLNQVIAFMKHEGGSEQRHIGKQANGDENATA